MSLRSPLKAVPLLVLLACVPVVLSGCTARQSQEQYEERLEQALETRRTAIARLETEELRAPADYDAEAERVVESLEELDADPPPGDTEAAHERMVAGMEGLAALLTRTGRCERLGATSAQDERACRQAIGQSVYDEIRNDFGEADTIYRERGFSLPGLGGGEDAEGGDSLGEDPEGGDEL